MTTPVLNDRLDMIQKEVNNIRAYLATNSLGEVQRELHNIEIDLDALRQQIDEYSQIKLVEPIWAL